MNSLLSDYTQFEEAFLSAYCTPGTSAAELKGENLFGSLVTSWRQQTKTTDETSHLEIFFSFVENGLLQFFLSVIFKHSWLPDTT